MRLRLLRPQSVSLPRPLSVDGLVGSSPLVHAPRTSLTRSLGPSRRIFSLTPGALHGIPAALPRFPKLASVPGIPAALPGKKICAYSAHTLRTLCTYSFSSHKIFNRTSPDKNVGTRLDNFAGAAALQLHMERRSWWTWFVLRFRCLGTFPEAWKFSRAQPCRYR